MATETWVHQRRRWPWNGFRRVEVSWDEVQTRGLCCGKGCSQAPSLPQACKTDVGQLSKVRISSDSPFVPDLWCESVLLWRRISDSLFYFSLVCACLLPAFLSFQFDTHRQTWRIKHDSRMQPQIQWAPSTHQENRVSSEGQVERSAGPIFMWLHLHLLVNCVLPVLFFLDLCLTKTHW